MEPQTPSGETPPELPPAEPPPPAPWGPPPAATPAAGGPVVNWAAPVPTAEVPGAPSLSFADTRTRLAAYIVDVAILTIVGVIIAAILGLGRATVTTSGSISISNQVYETSNPGFSLVLVVMGAVYFIWSWSGGRRATLGQRVFHLQVGNAFDGAPLSLNQAIRRWLGLGSFLGLLTFVPGVAGLAPLAQLLWVIALLITTANSPTKQGLHDRFANTAVVKPAGQRTSGLALACVIIVILFAFLAAIGVAIFILLGPAFLEEMERLGRSV